MKKRQFIGKIYSKSSKDKASEILTLQGIDHIFKVKGISIFDRYVDSPEKCFWFRLYVDKSSVEKAKELLSGFIQQ